METYYTAANFRLYLLSLILLAGLLVLRQLPVFRRIPRLLQASVFLLIAGIPACLLSRVCPYTGMARFLDAAGAVLPAAAAAAGLPGILRLAVHSYRNRRSAPLREETDKRVVDFLSGRFLVLDPQGNIIAGNLDCIPGLPEIRSHSFKAWTEDLSGLFPGGSGNADVLASLARLEDSDADLEGGGLHLRCRLTPLGRGGGEGFLFFASDFSEEYRLLRLREEQRRLAGLRVEQIRSQGESEAASCRAQRAAGFMDDFSTVIESGLRDLSAGLEELADGGIPDAAGLEAALNECRHTMADLRTAAHTIEIGANR